jgi:hypothetical protein
MDDDHRRAGLPRRAPAGITAVTATTVLAVALTAPDRLPDVLTGLAAVLTALLAVLRELRP